MAVDPRSGVYTWIDLMKLPDFWTFLRRRRNRCGGRGVDIAAAGNDPEDGDDDGNGSSTWDWFLLW